jgi:hypothetical protein
MAEEFVLLGAAQTAAVESSKMLPTRYALASPNPLPLFPDGAADRRGGGRAKYVAGAFIVLSAVVSPALTFLRRPREVVTNVEAPRDPVFLTDGVHSGLRGAETYRLAAAAGETLTVEARFEVGGDLALDLLNGSTVLIASGPTVSHLAERDGDLYVRVHNPNNLWHELVVSRVAPAPVPEVVTTNGVGAGLTRGLSASVAGTHHPLGPFHAEEGLLVVVRFEPAAGDVNARILDATGETCAWGNGSDGLKRLFVDDARRCRELFLCDADSFADVAVDLVETIEAGSWSLEAPSARRVFVPAGYELVVTASFSHGEGDVDVELLDASGGLLSSSTSSADQEAVSVAAVVDSEVILRLYHAGTPSRARTTVALDVVIE